MSDIRKLLLFCFLLLLLFGLAAVSCNSAGTFRKKRAEPFESNKCYIPDSSSTKFSWDSCSNFDNCTAIPPFTTVEHSSLLFVSCKDGFSREQDKDIYIINCDNGAWQPNNIFCRPIKYCQPLTSITVKAKCQKDGTPVDCFKEVRAGTSAKFDCKFGYQNNTEGFNDLEIACLVTGEWDSSIPQCAHECGRVSNTPITEGETGSIFNHPWTATIYYFKRRDLLKESSGHILCSGTLVTPSFVITAGHCFYKNGHASADNQISAESINVRLGKNNKELRDRKDPTAQILDVESINISPLFAGVDLRYFADLALLKLKTSAILSVAVMPACLDLDKKISLNSSVIGTAIAFLGQEHANKTDDFLTKAVEPYVSYGDCYTELRLIKYSEFITKDKFCSFDKDKNSTGIRAGFSGAGFIIEFGGKHYLMGIFSSLLRNYIATVTDLQYIYHAQFIKDLLK